MSTAKDMGAAASVCLLVAGLLGCAERDAVRGADGAPAEATRTPVSTAEKYGGVQTVDVETTGQGGTREEATQNALLRAIEQVHGRAMSVATISSELGSISAEATVSRGNATETRSARVSATVGGRQLMEVTRGLLTSVTILEEQEGRRGWTVRVLASVARFVAPDADKMKVVVAVTAGPDAAQLDDKAIRSLRDAVGAVLQRSGRAVLVDREASAAIADEQSLAMGEFSPAAEAVKVAQIRTADVVVAVRVERLNVSRSARRMRTADREIVRYSGDGRIGFRVTHVASRQVLASGGATAQRSSTESLTDDVDVQAWIDAMLEEMAAAVVQGVAASLFPIRVIDLAGAEVTLNAGEGRVSEATYDVYVLGADLVDPETGATLGRRERHCCAVNVHRITERLAFGTLDAVPSLQPGEVLEVRVVKGRE